MVNPPVFGFSESREQEAEYMQRYARLKESLHEAERLRSPAKQIMRGFLGGMCGERAHVLKHTFFREKLEVFNGGKMDLICFSESEKSSLSCFFLKVWLLELFAVQLLG